MDQDRLNSLIAAKFTKTGTWRRTEKGQAICIGEVPTSPGVYLFIVGGVIRYVGSAQKSLHSRMKSYERRQRDQKSDDDQKPLRVVHRELLKAMDGRKCVEVHTLVIDEPLRDDLDGLPIDYAIGLEGGLIRELDPIWNRRGRTQVLDDLDGSL